MARTPFIVDLTDPRDIRAKLVEGERILKAIDEQLAGFDDLQREGREWRANVEFLASKLPTDAREADFVAQTEAGASVVAEVKPHRGRERPLDCIVEVINREVRKMRAIEVHAILTREGHDFNPDQVRNALHYAAQKAKPALIQAAPGRGMYAPLAYREVELPSPSRHAPQAQAPEPLRGGIVEAGHMATTWGGGAEIRR